MISINFQLTNPWSKQKFHNLFNKAIKISKNKYFEYELLYSSEDLLGFTFHYNIRCDHAGATLMGYVLGLGFNLTFYDTRHWNDDKGAVMTENDNKIEMIENILMGRYNRLDDLGRFEQISKIRVTFESNAVFKEHMKALLEDEDVNGQWEQICEARVKKSESICH